MKSISKLLLALGLASCFSVQAQTENQDLCYPLAHGENGLGSQNSMLTPALIVGSVGWNTYVYVTNTSYKPINIKLEFLKYDATPYDPVRFRYFGIFDENNSPLNISTGGAILKPFETGGVDLYHNSISRNDGVIGRVSWQADFCLDKATKVDIRTFYDYGTNHGQGFVTLNGGNPF